jgi:citrate lyase synthetase
MSWTIILTIGNIIFLNFIIAEASSSYESVNERLDEIILKERTDLINESQVMAPDWLKSKDTFPKYIIIRQIDK